MGKDKGNGKKDERPPEKWFKCPYGCGYETLTLADLQAHGSTCPNRP